MTDEELAQRAALGAAQDFERLVERWQDRLHTFLRQRAGSAADDLYQEVWMKVWRHLPGYQPRERFAAWLFTIARNAAVDAAERAGRRGEVALETDGENGSLLESLSEAGSPESDALVADGRRRLDLALASLPTEQREVFLLREYGGLTFKEIAETQDCPLGTALARMRYAVAKLRDLLEEDRG